MNQALKAAMALVMGVGLAASAQAHGTNMHRAAMHRAAMPRTTAMTQRHARMDLSRQKIKTAQQELKADGLYKGKVDGRWDSRTRRAVARFQQRNGLQRTATLDRQTLDRLTGKQAVGVGSSRPKSSNMPQNRNANGKGSSNTPNTNVSGAGSGSSSNPTTPTMPPAATPSATGAGNNTGTTDQSPTTNK